MQPRWDAAPECCRGCGWASKEIRVAAPQGRMMTRPRVMVMAATCPHSTFRGSSTRLEESIVGLVPHPRAQIFAPPRSRIESTENNQFIRAVSLRPPLRPHLDFLFPLRFLSSTHSQDLHATAIHLTLLPVAGQCNSSTLSSAIKSWLECRLSSQSMCAPPLV